MWISGTSDGFSQDSDPKPKADPGLLAAEGTRAVSPREGAEVVEELGAHELGRMVLLVRSNDRLFDDLRANHARIAEALAYLSRDDANKALGWARMARLRDRHSAILTKLRANRIEGRRLLAQFETVPTSNRTLSAAC